MGLFDFLTGGNKCPACGTKGARRTETRVYCRNRACSWYDPRLAQGEAPSDFVSSSRDAADQLGAPAVPVTDRPAAPARGGAALARPISIRYRNFEGRNKTFIADAESAVRKKNHIVVRVAPSGQRITLSRDRIQNLDEVQASFPQPVAPGQSWPRARERQVLNYHKKYGTTSPLYEEIRARYPNW